MKTVSPQEARVLLTGVTGFLGKVVLEEIIRRREELRIETVTLLIRKNGKGLVPRERFQSEVVSSPCFSRLPHGWTKGVEVLAGELTEENCGLEEADRERLKPEVTHIINCAASVEFDLPLRLAAEANITTSLNLLEFARGCSDLESFVNVSTAYVTPHRGRVIEEKPVPLPRPAWKIYREILKDKADVGKLLRETGHPNTYALTKCLSEHLLMERRGEVPLTIIRPSIISASWRYPFPGWIDSQAAFAGFVVFIGAGTLRAVIARTPTHLDVVPCDLVANRIIDGTFEGGDTSASPETPIIHAVAGVRNSCRIDACIRVIEGFFRRHPVDRFPKLYYVGPGGLRFRLQDWRYHRLPTAFLKFWYRVKGNTKRKRQLERIQRQLNYLNTGFPYFTHNTFDFRSSVPLADDDFEKERYIETVCRGVYRYLLKRDETETVFAGRREKTPWSDLLWAIGQPYGNWAIRLASYAVRKALRKCAERVTFDRPAFEAARSAVPASSLVVIVPTHRSFMDFVLCSYLFFVHPDLGISIPHIAAAEEFSRIPILGWLFKKTRAFYVKRGVGREHPELTSRVRDLVWRNQTLEFFIEGTRSRSRKMLEPRRGMLRCLQSTGQSCRILPVTISYDRVPEEASFLRELRGSPKPPMRLFSFFLWIFKMLRGKIHLGRIHMTCGNPLVFDRSTDLHSLSREITAELQRGLVATTFHLRCFLRFHPEIGVDLQWLQEELMRRGGRVLESPLGGEGSIDPLMERTFRHQWMHLFSQEALQAGIFGRRHEDLRSERIRRVLFEPADESPSWISREAG